MSKRFISNEYFGTSNRKFCQCGNSKSNNFFWGGYIGKQFHTIRIFCLRCYEEKVRQVLLKEFDGVGSINIKGFRNQVLPNFLRELKLELEGKPQLMLNI